jgi:peroxiredoxin
MKKATLIITLIFTTLQLCAQNGLKKGDTAPLFTAVDNSGKKIDLKNILKEHKSVVLFFYRGQWCPYCNKYIQQLQDSLQTLTAKGAYVIGITPETGENINKTINKTKASFSMIYDKDRSIMKSYDVNYVMEQSLFERYKKNGVDMEANNGNADHVLPVPATYIISKSGKLAFVHFDKDYKRRPTIKSLLAEL